MSSEEERKAKEKAYRNMYNQKPEVKAKSQLYHRQYYAKNKDKIKMNNRIWYQQNKPRINQQQRIRYHTPEQQARRKAYNKIRSQRPEVKIKIRIAQKKYLSKPEIKAKQRQYRLNARSSGKEKLYRQRCYQNRKNPNYQTKHRNSLQPCPICNKLFYDFTHHKCYTVNPTRFAELQKLKSQQTISSIDCCKKLCCKVSRDLASERLKYILKPHQIVTVQQIIQIIEKGIFQITGLTPQLKPSNIVAVAFYYWNKNQDDRILQDDLLKICTISSVTLYKVNKYLHKLGILRILNKKFNIHEPDDLKPSYSSN